MESIRIKDREFDLFLAEDEIKDGICRVAAQMNEDLRDKEPLFLVVLNGAFMFASDLIGQFNHPCEITFIRLKSYEGMERGIRMKEIYGLAEEIKDRHIVVVEDVIDTGHTMSRLLELLEVQQPASIRIATLLFKPDALQIDINPDYVAKAIPNDFIVGYGLDYDGHGRNLRNIYKVRS